MYTHCYLWFHLPLTAGKVNYRMELATLNGTIRNNFSIPCNIELGVNTAQTGYRVTVSRRIFYNDRNDTFPLLNYRNNIDPEILSVSSTATDTTSYRFYSSNLTLYVENFSVPFPRDVRGVKFICEFYVANQGKAIFAITKTAVILRSRKFINHVCWSLISCMLSVTNWAVFFFFFNYCSEVLHSY